MRAPEKDHEWSARNKTDLMIEVWEKLDCESVGAAEIDAIETVVKECYGEGAADTPMAIARLLADEGAVLRHPEIFEMDARRRLTSPYEAMFRNLVKLDSLASAERSLRGLENLRRKFEADENKEGLRLVRDAGIAAKEELRERSSDGNAPELAEAAEWFAIWLQSPEVFESWVQVRRRSAEFRERFGAGPEDGFEEE